METFSSNSKFQNWNLAYKNEQFNWLINDSIKSESIKDDQ